MCHNGNNKRENVAPSIFLGKKTCTYFKDCMTPVLPHLPLPFPIKPVYLTGYLRPCFHSISVGSWESREFLLQRRFLLNVPTNEKRRNVSTSSVSVFFSSSLFLSPFSHSGKCRRRRGSIVNSGAWWWEHSLYLHVGLGGNKCSLTTHTHRKREREGLHVTKRYLFNSVNNNISLRPSTTPPSPLPMM